MNKKIVNVVLVILIMIFVLNSVIAYGSYLKACEKNEPLIYFFKESKSYYTIYNVALYKIKVENRNNKRITSLKLFFIE